MITALITAIPSLIKLFDSDSRDSGVKELTNTVIGQVSEKLGIDFTSGKEVISHLEGRPEDAIKLREIEASHIESIAKLDLENKIEDNRHDEHSINKQIEDSSSAREMFKHGSELQTKVASDIMTQTQWRIPFWMILNIGLLIAAESFKISPTVVLAAGNLIGMALKSDYDERTGVRNFLFGAMIAKVKKDK